MKDTAMWFSRALLFSMVLQAVFAAFVSGRIRGFEEGWDLHEQLALPMSAAVVVVECRIGATWRRIYSDSLELARKASMEQPAADNPCEALRWSLEVRR